MFTNTRMRRARRAIAVAGTVAALGIPLLGGVGTASAQTDAATLVWDRADQLKSTVVATGSTSDLGGGDAPATSRDGARIAFVTTHTLVIADRSGSVGRVLEFPASYLHGQPSWSPDNRQVVFSRSWPGGPRSLWIADADSGSVRRLTKPAAGTQDDAPAWSPDGKLIAFNRTSATTRTLSAISPWRTGLRTLTKGSQALFDPSWSPRGDLLVGVDISEPNNQLATVRRDGSGFRRITNERDLTLFWTPQWSPDGGQIAVARMAGPGNDVMAVWLYSSNGTQIRRVAVGTDDEIEGIGWLR